MPNLRRNESNSLHPKALVKMSASWSYVDTWIVLITPLIISSRTNWQMIPICFVFLCRTGLALMCKADLLSQQTVIGSWCETPISRRSSFNQISSCVIAFIARNSASVDDKESFVVFQAMGEVPNWIIQPVRDRWEVGHAPQSASHQPVMENVALALVEYLGRPSLLNIE